MKPLKVYKNLYNYFGPQGWWPRTSPAFGGTVRGRPIRHRRMTINNSQLTINKNDRFEICIGAILTQNTAWKNVEKALVNLSLRGNLTPQFILSCKNLEKLIRPAGYYNQKAKKLKIFSEFILKNYNGDLQKFFNGQMFRLRRIRCQLLGLWGIGPETADSMILYAGGKPSFVIDAYTKRLCECFGVRFKTYDEYKKFFTHQLPRSAKLYNEFHALIVAWGKLYSKDKQTALKILLLR